MERRERNAKARLRTARRKLAEDDELLGKLEDLLAGAHNVVIKQRIRDLLDGVAE